MGRALHLQMQRDPPDREVYLQRLHRVTAIFEEQISGALPTERVPLPADIGAAAESAELRIDAGGGDARGYAVCRSDDDLVTFGAQGFDDAGRDAIFDLHGAGLVIVLTEGSRHVI